MLKIFKISVVSSVMLISYGCVSDSDFSSAQRQIDTLTAKLSSAERDISTLKNEMEIVKNKRAINLPTGAPTVTKSRVKKATVSTEESSYNSALQLYKNGDISAAIRDFEQFNNRYANSKYQPSVLYYLGSASYTQRDYYRAEQVLEELIYQHPMDKVNPRAPDLLKNVYLAQGKSGKANELKSFIDSASNNSVINNSIPATDSIGVEYPAMTSPAKDIVRPSLAPGQSIEGMDKTVIQDLNPYSAPVIQREQGKYPFN